jgi:hypothetical protein
MFGRAIPAADREAVLAHSPPCSRRKRPHACHRADRLKLIVCCSPALDCGRVADVYLLRTADQRRPKKPAIAITTTTAPMMQNSMFALLLRSMTLPAACDHAYREPKRWAVAPETTQAGAPFSLEGPAGTSTDVRPQTSKPNDPIQGSGARRRGLSTFRIYRSHLASLYDRFDPHNFMTRLGVWSDG